MLASGTGLAMRDRNIDKNFRNWLERCHRDFDKTCLYKEPMGTEEMMRLRKLFGFSNTFYKRVSGGSRTVEVCRALCCDELTQPATGHVSRHAVSTSEGGQFHPLHLCVGPADRATQCSTDRYPYP